MSYDPNVPNASQSPGLFPPQNGTNFSRLKTIINADHVFSDASTGGEGFHKQCTMIARAIPAGVIPGGANSILYTFVDSFGQSQLGFYNGTINYPITSFRMLAAVNFNGLGSTGDKTIRSSYNVSSVNKTDTGSYQINFATNLANTDYIVHVTGKGAGQNGISNGAVRGNASYNTVVQVGFVQVVFNGSGSNLLDVEMGNILVFGV